MLKEAPLKEIDVSMKLTFEAMILRSTSFLQSNASPPDPGDSGISSSKDPGASRRPSRRRGSVAMLSTWCWCGSNLLSLFLPVSSSMILDAVSSISPSSSLRRTLWRLAADSVGSATLVYWLEF
ncbi:hypothetical protein F2Q68_00008376 [Brassica cretica]|uniref:Uncharacterized protein n=1 Tax=Brassica cretica TaxID=69181 RepID=A0A8S9KVG1_BRACR|nr:hypothetical protein F2Q68_00008376 [Brassica cretica]